MYEQDEEHNPQHNINGRHVRYVVMISKEGQRFTLDREHAVLSANLKYIFEKFERQDECPVFFIINTEIRCHILGHICMYLKFKYTIYNGQPISHVLLDLPIKKVHALDILTTSIVWGVLKLNDRK